MKRTPLLRILAAITILLYLSSVVTAPSSVDLNTLRTWSGTEYTYGDITKGKISNAGSYAVQVDDWGRDTYYVYVPSTTDPNTGEWRKYNSANYGSNSDGTTPYNTVGTGTNAEFVNYVYRESGGDEMRVLTPSGTSQSFTSELPRADYERFVYSQTGRSKTGAYTNGQAEETLIVDFEVTTTGLGEGTINEYDYFVTPLYNVPGNGLQKPGSRFNGQDGKDYILQDNGNWKPVSGGDEVNTETVFGASAATQPATTQPETTQPAGAALGATGTPATPPGGMVPGKPIVMPATINAQRADADRTTIETIQTTITRLDADRLELSKKAAEAAANGQKDTAARYQKQADEKRAEITRLETEKKTRSDQFQKDHGISVADYSSATHTAGGGTAARYNGPQWAIADLNAPASKPARLTVDGRDLRLTTRTGETLTDSEGYKYYEGTANPNELKYNKETGQLAPITDSAQLSQLQKDGGYVWRMKQLGGKTSSIWVGEHVKLNAQGAQSDQTEARIFDTTKPYEQSSVLVRKDKLQRIYELSQGKQLHVDGGRIEIFSSEQDSTPDAMSFYEGGVQEIIEYDDQGRPRLYDRYSADGKTVTTTTYEQKEIKVGKEKKTVTQVSEMLTQTQVGTKTVDGNTVAVYEYEAVEVSKQDQNGNPLEGKVIVRDEDGNAIGVYDAKFQSDTEKGWTYEKGGADTSRLKTEQTYDTSRKIFGGANFVLTEFQGFSGYSQLFFRKQLAPWRESVDKFFAQTYLGSQYWASKLCSSWGDSAGDNVAYFETPRGVITVGAHIEAERSDPIYGFDPATNRTTVEYFYKITFAVDNPNKYKSERPKETDLIFNVRLTGQREILLYPEDVKVKEGKKFYRSGTSAVVQYSPYLYEEACIEFENSVRSIGGSYIDQVCNDIVASNTPASTYEGTTTSTGASSTASGSIVENQI